MSSRPQGLPPDPSAATGSWRAPVGRGGGVPTDGGWGRRDGAGRRERASGPRSGTPRSGAPDGRKMALAAGGACRGIGTAGELFPPTCSRAAIAVRAGTPARPARRGASCHRRRNSFLAFTPAIAPRVQPQRCSTSSIDALPATAAKPGSCRTPGLAGAGWMVGPQLEWPERSRHGTAIALPARSFSGRWSGVPRRRSAAGRGREIEW